MSRTWVFNTPEARAAYAVIGAQLQGELKRLGITKKPDLDAIIAYSVNRFEERMTTGGVDAKALDAAHQVYAQYMLGESEQTRAVIDEETEARIQRLGLQLQERYHLNGLRSPKGYNRKLIVLLAVLMVGASGSSANEFATLPNKFALGGGTKD